MTYVMSGTPLQEDFAQTMALLTSIRVIKLNLDFEETPQINFFRRYDNSAQDSFFAKLARVAQTLAELLSPSLRVVLLWTPHIPTGLWREYRVLRKGGGDKIEVELAGPRMEEADMLGI